jgi:hypothetical protein
MYKFKDPTLKEATHATIIDQFQHDYSSKIALFLESKSHLCKSCNGDSDSLIFLTPVQSMKLGMSILDTFHERKLKQLNQRLQSMIYKHFSINEDHQLEQKNLIQQFHQQETNRTRSSSETLGDSKDSARNNHSLIRNSNEVFKRYLIERNQYRLIITRRLFKFRRKRSKNFNTNNTQTINEDPPRRSIEQILYHQWIEKKSQRTIKRGKKNLDRSE